jgi:type VI secretion system protein
MASPIVITVFDSETGGTSEYSFTTSPVRIGRNNLNDLTLPFPFVSGWHAVVRFDDQQAKFFDLGSTNGTLYNGRRVEAGEAVVVHGELSLTIGKLELRVRHSAAGVAPGPVPPASMSPMPGPVSVYGGPQPPAPVYTGPVPMVGTPPRSGTAVAGSAAAQRPGQPAAKGTIDPDHLPKPRGAPEGTAHVEMSDVHQAVNRLRPYYDGYRQAWQGMAAELRAVISAMDPGLKPFALSIVSREFPEVTGQAEFAELARSAGVPTEVAATGSAGPGADVTAVASMAKSLRPEDEPPRSLQEAQRFLSCVEDVLRASAKAVVELQRGQEQFGSEMGVRTIKEFTALHAAGTPEKVLQYLLDWQAGGPHRTQELVGMYADLMIHQVALINGIMAGVRSLLSQISPEAIERQVKSGWPTRQAALWKHFTEVFRELCEADKKLTSAVFGPDFARAYAEVGGEG